MTGTFGDRAHPSEGLETQIPHVGACLNYSWNCRKAGVEHSAAEQGWKGSELKDLGEPGQVSLLVRPQPDSERYGRESLVRLQPDSEHEAVSAL